MSSATLSSSARGYNLWAYMRHGDGNSAELINTPQLLLRASEADMNCVVPFTKMHGLGNDFVVVQQSQLESSELGRRLLSDKSGAGAQLARRICDRHFGIGADGFIVIGAATRTDCAISWTYFNSDGSLSRMCGNGLRCAAVFGISSGLVSRNEFSIDTPAGPVAVQVQGDWVSTDIGEPILDSEDIPVTGPKRSPVLKEELRAGDKKLTITCVSMGNPHCVTFVENLDQLDWRGLAVEMQSLSFFPEGVNIEFVQVISPNHARVAVWERGCGPTLACASGAAGVLVAGVLEGRLDRKAKIDLPGGGLEVSWLKQDNHVLISGPAQMSYRGEFDLQQYASNDIHNAPGRGVRS